jgi:DNA polymerase III subunit delta
MADDATDRRKQTSGGPPSLALYWGEDEFLLREAAHELLAEHGARPDEVAGPDWRGGETANLVTPSLFGDRRALLVTAAQSLPEAGAKELRDYLEAPAPDAVLVVTAVSRGKSGPALAKAVTTAGGLVQQLALRRQDVAGWVMTRAKSRGVRLSGPGAAALVGAVGESPAQLAQAVEQIGTAFAGQAVGPEQVRAQFRGLGDQQIWDLCDHALAGRLAAALVTLRALLEDREAGLLILGGVAARVRDLIRIRALPDRMPAADAARAAGLRFDWQVRRYREQASRFTPAELNALHRRLLEADRALKGGVPEDVVLPGLVAALAGRADTGHVELTESFGR